MNAVQATSHKGVTLYVGGDPARWPLEGRRCFTAAHRPRTRLDATRVTALLDSGAFSDPQHRRLHPEAALVRQLAWERQATAFWHAKTPWCAQALVSYHRLIDEVWTSGPRGLACHKQRWTVPAAEAAVIETIEAAWYLASQRARLAPRTLVLACQGVDAAQYRECVAEVLSVATPQDWIGLGGWCILGRSKRQWLPAFWQTLHVCLPMIAAAGVRHVHVFGVLWRPALGGLLWLADRHGLTASTDSSAPLLAATWPDPQKAGVRAATYRGNVAWWRLALASLRTSHFYREPPLLARQLALAL
jgi:hypothetical protein